VKAQEEAPYCLACPTHNAIRNYSKTRFAALAREAAAQLEQFGALGTFGDDHKHRTLWDEYCYKVQEGPHNNLLEAAFAAIVEPVAQAIVGFVTESEATLLTIGARWHLDEDQEANVVVVAVPDLMRRNLEDAIQTLAMSRDMSGFDPLAEEGPWPIRVQDVAPLERLVEAVRSLAPLSQCGNDLIAVGEACCAIEKILENQIIDVDVGLTVGFRNGDSDFSEGIFAGIRINANEIVLDELNTTYSSESGSDQFTRVYASLKPGGGLEESEIEDWINKLEELQRCIDAKLGVQRDHT
jgi:hypothetical protein